MDCRLEMSVVVVVLVVFVSAVANVDDRRGARLRRCST